MTRLLRVNMSEGSCTLKDVPESLQGLAGRGLTSAMVAGEVPPTCDPLGAQNKIVIAPGALSGTNAPNSGRLSIGLKSPLTGTIKESNVGGTAAYRLGRLQIGALVVEGRAEPGKWYVLLVSKDGCEIIPANEYKGMKNYALVERLQEKYGERVSILSIGPAGEMLLPVATIAATDTAGYPSRHAGRGGPGAVMGSKGLKAIMIDDMDGPGVVIADAERFKEGAKKFARAIQEHPLTNHALRMYGTNVLASVINAAGAYPTRNFRAGVFEGVDKVSGEHMYEVITRRGGKPSHTGCSMCIIQCSNVYPDDKGNYLTSALEYETIWAHGANLGIDDLDSIARVDRLCDEYGIDTMELGVAIAVAMEAGVRQFGDAAGALELVEEVGKGTPLGRILGGGSWNAGKELGVTRVAAVKKQGMAGYEPRAIHGMGVSYATSTMGADHTAGWVVNTNLASMGGRLDPHKPDGQVDNSRMVQILTAAMDCTGLCTFVNFPVKDIPDGAQGLFEMMSGFYGKEFTLDDMVNLGKAVLKVEHQFNEAAGMTSADDRLPGFIKEEKLGPDNVSFTVSDSELDRLWREF
jgi:aldehyde:ferredoxin oxidoreductase